MARAWLSIAVFAGLAGCANEELPGSYWDVELQGTTNACTSDAPNYSESFQYRVVFSGNDITLAVEDDVFATGSVEGCTLTYSSTTWTDERNGNALQYQILGNAKVDQGGGGCTEGSDWEGTEQFIVVYSEDPEVSAGCTYDIDLTGTFVKEVP